MNGYGGGNMLSTDGGETWADASKGYTGAQMAALSVYPDASKKVFAMGKSGSWYSEDDGRTWEGRRLAPWFTQIYRERNGTTEILRTGDGGDGNIYRSTDGGATWQATLVVGAGVQFMAGKALVMAPSDTEVLYLGYGQTGCMDWDFPDCDAGAIPPGLYRSGDGGYTWDHVETTPFGDSSILSLAVSLDDPNTVFAATMVGPYVTRDGGNTWQFLAFLDDMAGWSPPRPGIVGPSVYVLAADPFDPQTIYAGCTMAAVLRSTNGGETWEQAAAGLDPNEAITDLRPDPNRPGLLYASARFSGVFVSADGGQTWRKITDGLHLPKVRTLGLSDDGTVLYAGTNGAGVFRLGPFPEGLDDYIQGLPDDCFKNSPDQRKNALHNKLMAVWKLIEEGKAEAAMEKLDHDIRAKMDGEGKDDWITCAEGQEDLLQRIDRVLEYLEEVQ